MGEKPSSLINFEQYEGQLLFSKYQAVFDESASAAYLQVPSAEPKVRQTTRLSCSARGNPPPTLYWTIDGRVLENSAATRIVTKK